jgi:hypothetical protein
MRHLRTLVTSSVAAFLAAACSEPEKILIVPPTAVASVTFESPLPAQMTAGDTALLRAIARDAQGNELSGRTVEWLTSDQSVLVVGSSGRVLAAGPGVATVIARVEGVRATTSTSIRLTAPERRFAYAMVAHDATVGPTHPNLTLNATGGEVRVSARPRSGDYVVTFERLARADTSWRETVMVTPGYSGFGTRCHLNGWGAATNGRDLDVSVSCYASDDSKIDKEFHIAVIGSGAVEGRHGFVTSADSAQSHTPAASAFYNSSGQPMTVDRTGMGAYRVNVNNARTSMPENYFITTIGGPAATCLLDGWSFGTYSRSRCEWSDGAAADARFAMQLIEGGRPGKRFAFAWASSPSQPLGVEYEPSTGYQRMSTGARVMITRVMPGVYDVRFPGLGPLAFAKHHLQTSPYLTSRVSCLTWTLPPSGADFVARVNCVSRGTLAAIDAYFTILLLE